MTVLDAGDAEVFSYTTGEDGEVAGFDPVVYDAGICEVVDMTEDGEAGDVYGAGGGGLV